MPNRTLIALSAAALFVAANALAEAPPSGPSGKATATNSAPSANSEIVVIGRPTTTPQTFEQAATRFVHDLARLGPVGQVSRWRQPVCPIAAGLTPEFNDFVINRIKDVIARVGVPTGDCPAGANVMIAFTTMPDKLMTDVRDHHEALLGYHPVGQTKSIAAFRPPMKSWYVTMTSITGEGGARFDTANGPGPPGGTGSHVHTPLTSEFAFVLVVVDSNLLEGQTIGPVADKVAMLALSRPAPRSGCSALPSVMDLLEPDCPTSTSGAGLTAYDESYLKELYAYRGDEQRYFERRTIAKRIAKDLGPSPPASGGHAP
jgi:hypothetical protein